MRLYVAGKVTGVLNNNRPAFEYAALRLEDAGYDVVVPHWFIPSGVDWQTAMRRSIELLTKCDGVAMLDGWEHSKGAKIERRLAMDMGMPVMDVQEWRTVSV